MNPCDEHGVNVLRYLDNELSGPELEKFCAHLMTCASCQERLEKEKSLSCLLQRTRPLYSAPPELHARVAAVLLEHTAAERARESRRPGFMRSLTRPLLGAAQRSLSWKVLTPAVLAIALCLVFAPDTVQQVRAASYVETAVATHRNYLDGSLPLEVRSDSPEVVTAWFTGKVPFHFRLPSSQSDDGSTPMYRLTGGRLVDYKGSHAALVTYETAKEKISLLIASAESAVIAGGDEVRSGELTFHYRTDAGFKVITWSTHGLAYALVSSLPGSAQQSCMVCHQHMSDHAAFKPTP